MSDQEFKKGDVVRLKSGGPKMTVVNTPNGNLVECMWFDSKNERQSNEFSLDSLKHFKPGRVLR